MAKITISRAELREHGLPDDGYDGVEIIQDVIDYHSRWSVGHELTFKWIDGKTYQTSYSVGATEMQDEEPWEYDEDVECVEVHKVQRLVDIWEVV